MTTETTPHIPTEWWNGKDGDLDGPERASLEVERDETNPGVVAIHTMKDGTGSHASYYLSREDALRFAKAIIDAVVLR